MDVKLTEQDKDNLEEHYPKLNCNLRSSVVWGTLDLSCSYDKKADQLVYDNSGCNYIEDNYEIRIDFNKKKHFNLPMVLEESRKIVSHAISLDMESTEFHVEEDGSCCLGIFPNNIWKGTVDFISHKIIPFLYWQSHVRIYGKQPWKGYSHGADGIREAMTLSAKEAGKNRNRSCPCRSGRKYKRCCLRRDEVLKTLLLKSREA